MNLPTSNAVRLLCCSALQAEVQLLRDQYWPDAEFKLLSSMLHMKPVQLGVTLKKVAAHVDSSAGETVLIFGDCAPQMSELEAEPHMARVKCSNCCDLLLGKEAFRKLSHEGAFFLTPEWARRWETVFARELGLNRDNARALMNDMQKSLIYLDTGLTPVPRDALAEFSEYCGLPWEVHPTPLDHLRLSIEDAIQRVRLTFQP